MTIAAAKNWPRARDSASLTAMRNGLVSPAPVGDLEPDIDQITWFAIRQPGVVLYLEQRCGPCGDTLPIALEASWRICASVEFRDGVPPPRIPRSLLERAEAAIRVECAHPREALDGCAARQPELCGWIGALIDDPPLPLNARERSLMGTVLLAIVYAMDELTTGRIIP